MKLNLPDVTIICVDTKNYSQALFALKESVRHVTPAKCLFLTDIEFKAPEGIEVVKISKINSKREYSGFIIRELYKYFDTSHCLIVQWDGYITTPSAWIDEFLQWDYIGAPWNYDAERAVGNGGFSLRSHKLCKILGQDSFIRVVHPEDQSICILYKYYMEENYGIKFAPKELASQFAYETIEPTSSTFGFHNFGQRPFKEHMVIKRTGACGDVVMIEPLIQYYHDKGYQVVLDTQPQFMSLFFQHPFLIKHISQMNPAIVPRETIDLDMAYEMKPQQPVLKSYMEKAGIEIPLRNSRLNVFCPPEWKIFKKYALIHADSTSIPHRDINDLDWHSIVKYLENQGYAVFQIGRRTTKEIATHFNTPTIEGLMYLIKGADLVIGLDSGNCQISVALGVPTIILAGSVNLSYRYNDFTLIRAIQGKCPSDEHAYCYHQSIGVSGQDCVYNKHMPPCTFFKADDVIDAIIDLTKNK